MRKVAKHYFQASFVLKWPRKAVKRAFSIFFLFLSVMLGKIMRDIHLLRRNHFKKQKLQGITAYSQLKKCFIGIFTLFYIISEHFEAILYHIYVLILAKIAYRARF